MDMVGSLWHVIYATSSLVSRVSSRTCHRRWFASMPTSDTPKDSIIPPDELSMIHNAIDSFDSSENKFAARAARARELVRDSEDLHREIINRQEYSPGKGHSTDALPVQ
jgi:hypothetical protein